VSEGTASVGSRKAVWLQRRAARQRVLLELGWLIPIEWVFAS